MDRLRELHPDGIAELERTLSVARRSTDPELLDLCAGRVDAMLLAVPFEDPEGLAPRERAYLEFTEQFVTSVSTVLDAQIAALLEHATPEEVYEFIGALYVLEMARRVEIVSSAVIA